MEIKNEKPYIPALLKNEELNQLITLCYYTSMSYLKYKFNNSVNLDDISQLLENLSINVSASIFYFDELKCLRLSPQHEKAMIELNEVDFKFYLFETIRNKLDEAITNNSILEG